MEMKRVIIALAAIAAFLGFGFGPSVDCGNCKVAGVPTIATIGFVAPAMAAQPVPKELSVPKFCEKVEFTWLVQYDISPMKRAGISNGKQVVDIGWGDRVPGSQDEREGYLKRKTTGKGFWAIEVDTSVSYSVISVTARTLDGRGMPLWTAEWTKWKKETGFVVESVYGSGERKEVCWRK